MRAMNRRALVLLSLPVLLLALAPAVRAQHPETGFIEMPAPTDGSYTLGSGVGSGRHWARPETVHFLLLVAREWQRRHGDAMVLRIGDISKPDGSNFPPHKTHQDGLAIDIVTRGPNITRIEYDDQEPTLELARLMVRYGARQILYNHPYVIDRVDEVQRWEKHDDHFHVVVDPDRVPKGEGPFLIPTGRRPTIGVADLEGGALVVEWSYLAEQRGWQAAYRVQVDGDEDHRTVDHDSGWVASADKAHRAIGFQPVDGRTYHIKVEVRGPGDEVLALPWRSAHSDLAPPAILPLRPVHGEEIEGNPVISWTYQDDGGPQAAFRIELDGDRSHNRIDHDTGPIAGDATRHELQLPLRPRRTYYWRLVVEDPAGNETATEWQSFKTAAAFRGGRFGTVNTDGLNFRKGPGTGHDVVGQLDSGAEVEILDEDGGWLRVRYRKGRRSWVGFVHSKYVDE